jgi:hypothetical protein
MPLNTDFNVSPYYDDYDETKKYYRILFKPATAVQARELTQLQTIIQTQIERFGDSIYKSGSIIQGCGIVTIPSFDYVAIEDQDNSNGNLVVPSTLIGTIAESATSGLKAYVMSSVVGNSLLEYPENVNKLYVRYLNSGNTSGTETKVFADDEILNFYTTNTSIYTYTANTTSATNVVRVTSNTGIVAGLFAAAKGITSNVYVSAVSGNNVTLNSAVTIANNEVVSFFNKGSVNGIESGFYNVSTQPSEATGYGYGLTCQEGIIYQKGFFIKVDNHTIVVSNTSTNPGNTVVGFTTTESIVSYNQDASLTDNALGYSNENAPGADRLKLVATLVPLSPTVAANTVGFTSIVQFNDGIPFIKNTDPAYSRLGDELARRTNETSGNYVINPFAIDTVPHSSNSQSMVLTVSPGLGYVQGHRIELIGRAAVDVARGIETSNAASQIVTASYGNYVYCNELTGPVNFNQIQTVTIYDQPQRAITNYLDRTSGTPVGTAIGTANLRTVMYVDGIRGAPTGRYAFYLFNIKITSAGRSFTTDAKSFYVNNTPRTFADIILNTSNRAIIYDGEIKNTLYTFGKKAIKNLRNSSNSVDAQFVARTSANTTLYSNGIISLTVPASHGGGTDRFPYSTGILSNSNDSRFIVTLLASGNTANLTGSVSVNTTSTNLVGTSTTFTSQFANGEYIGLTDGSSFYYKRVTNVISNTLLTVDSAFSVTNTSIKYFKHYPAGYIVPMERANVNITSTTTALIDTLLQNAGNLLTTPSVKIDFDILRTGAAPARKQINKNTFVKIDTATHSANTVGPWSLGIPDVHRLRNIWVGSTFANTNRDMTGNFYFETGQKDTHYDLATLYLKNGVTLTAADKILISLDCFTSNTVSGVGYYSVDSYPIDDANTANTTAITTSNIPLYVSETAEVYSLRDSIDFRPYVAATANIATTIANATTNPSANASSFLVGMASYIPSPDQNFQSSISYYLGRKDIVYFDINGNIKIKSGDASETPTTPSIPDDGMAVAILDVKPFPSLTSVEKQFLSLANLQASGVIRDLTYGNQNNIITNRRYTMKDIGAIESRISRLEYYTALSLLEKSAIDMQISDENGLSRFKNGIFVEPFSSHVLGDVSNPEYRIAIDKNRNVARPYFIENNVRITHDDAASSNTVRNTRAITLPYTDVLYVSQPKSSRTIASSIIPFNWAGNITLYPNYTDNVDKINQAAVHLGILTSEPWIDFANSPWGTNYGQWRTTNSTTTTQTSTAGEYTLHNNITASEQIRDVDRLVVTQVGATYNIGDMITDVSIVPYMAARQIAFTATNLRPLTRVWAFFDDVNVSTYCALGVEAADTSTYADHERIVRTAAWGTPLITDATGVLHGKFTIPAGTFRTGSKRFRLADVENVVTNSSNITTSATATFSASNIAVKSTAYTLTTVSPEISINSTTEVQTVVTSQTQTNITYNPIPRENVNSGTTDDGQSTGGVADSGGGGDWQSSTDFGSAFGSSSSVGGVSAASFGGNI